MFGVGGDDVRTGDGKERRVSSIQFPSVTRDHVTPKTFLFSPDRVIEALFGATYATTPLGHGVVRTFAPPDQVTVATMGGGDGGEVEGMPARFWVHAASRSSSGMPSTC